EGTSEGPDAFSPDGTRLLIKRGLLDKDVAPAGYPHCCRWPFVHVVAPVSGGGPAVILGSEEHPEIGGGGGHRIFSPEGTMVVAVYTQEPVGNWLFDVTSGRGERVAWSGETWQRLAP